MIAAWMLYAALVGALFALAALAADRAARLAGAPARAVWAAALLGALAAPAMLATRAVRARAIDSGHDDSAPAALASAVRMPAIVVRPDGPAAALDPLLLAAWAVATASGLAWCAGGAWHLRRRRRAWPRTLVDGVAVRVSPDTGPAVVGVAPAEIVVPRWALALPREQRTLALAHERSHVAAGDPALLLASSVAVWLAPWNPALWFILSRMRAAIELDCDARVLHVHPQPRAYASLLLDVSERALAMSDLSPFPMPPALARAAPLLARRIAAMTSARSRFAPLRFAGGVALTLGLLAAAGAAPRPVRAHTPVTRSMAGPRSTAASDTEPLYQEFRVDTAVKPISMTPPHYPDSLRAAKIEGQVLLQFVVDTSGHPEMGTVRVRQSTNIAFTRAAIASLGGARFSPARVKGRAVRQVVQLPFQFALR